ncbi:MAG: hypothetical protein N0E54_01015 [Candidatus Thiodiazotropha taylori]|nr:hypothetical protein [Candidatus Thiodiazotropha endolucinida]MCW4227298.1 hypothetical protein [Candidatus Thiodiazotropha taylori]
MMNRDNACMGAAHPQEATEEAHANSSSNFNKFISLENNRLRGEFEQHAKDKQAFPALDDEKMQYLFETQGVWI